MAGTPLTQFKLSSSRLRPLRECMQSFGAGRDPEAEWPMNILSKKTVIYESGAIARRGDPVRHNVDPEEFELCRKLAREAHRTAKDIEFGLDTEAEFAFSPFFIVANIDDPIPRRINEALIRSKFGGTIFPLATISVQPLSEEASWWAEVSGGEANEEDVDLWRTLMRWFREQAEFKDTAFVSIGDIASLQGLDQSKYPKGTVSTGSSLPRLVVGLTKNGSLAGLFGHVVQT